MGKDKWIAAQNWPACAVSIIRIQIGKPQNRLATVGEAAKLIGVSRANVYNWMNAWTMRGAKSWHIDRVVELSGLRRDMLTQEPPKWLVQESRKRDE